MKNYYQVLGIAENADVAAIKAAYRRLALEYHPDRNRSADAATRFIAVKEAYDVLSDAGKRRVFDMQLYAMRNPASPGAQQAAYSRPQSTKAYREKHGSRSKVMWAGPILWLLFQLIRLLISESTTTYHPRLYITDTSMRKIMLHRPGGVLRKTDSVNYVPNSTRQ